MQLDFCFELEDFSRFIQKAFLVLATMNLYVHEKYRLFVEMQTQRHSLLRNFNIY